MANSNTILRKLMKALKKTTVTASTPEEKQKLAEERYASAYGEKELAARQSYEAREEALTEELKALTGSYDKQRSQSAANYTAAYSAQDRNALKKGMQRSSYNGQTLAGIAEAGAQAQQELNRQEEDKRSTLQEQRSSAAQALAEKLEQYQKSKQNDIAAYVEELSAEEKERQDKTQQEYNSLLNQIYQYRRSLEKDRLAQRNWRAEFRAKYGKEG